MDYTIEDAARAAGCRGYFAWAITPELFAAQLLSAVKRYSRFLKSEGVATSHSDALEKVARASGFPNWHALQTVIQGVIDDFNTEVHWPRPPGGGVRIKPLASAIHFMVEIGADSTPTAEEQVGLQKAANQLAQSCNYPSSSILDMIGKMNGADSWEKLLNRRPEDATAPLCSFSFDDLGNGVFRQSRACIELVERQDNLFQDYHSRSRSEQSAFEVQLNEVLSKRPDFIEGLLAKTEIIRYPTDENLGKLFSDAIGQADKLIPAGFKGQIS